LWVDGQQASIVLSCASIVASSPTPLRSEFCHLR
jgi:hypothetical protein